LIAFQCGPARFEIAARDLAEADEVERRLVVHETGTATSEDQAPSIQAVFRALVDDERRTEQICADVHDALTGGRACLVLTQRTDHLEAIVARLSALGDDPLVLRGGLGKKARAAVAEAIATRPEGAGIVLVATGSYLGEGFDWPELDTLFLAFPLAFKGRVVQYVGRLLRPHAGKSRVELHDYVDARIPVLERMHRKRLPAYSALGFRVPRGRRRSRPATTIASGGADGGAAVIDTRES
jgi:superfamily II DNA or RNA helicase